MKGELERAIYDGIVEDYKKARMIKGNPIEVYANKIGMGPKTLERRLNGMKPWVEPELELINRDLKDATVQELCKKRFDW
jgi:hypothetical protein